MATSTIETPTFAESPVQFEPKRDLRSANKEWKRGKDSDTKWSYGSRTREAQWQPICDAEQLGIKARPIGKASDLYVALPSRQVRITDSNRSCCRWGLSDKDRGNINKYARTTGRIREIGNGRIRSKVSAREELDEATGASQSIFNYLPASPRRQVLNPMDNVLYSFDRADSPGRPLTLEVFVKNTGRDTEKFVEKEYEILDVNGDALKGRKARRNLRGGASSGAKSTDAEVEVDEDEYEIL